MYKVLLVCATGMSSSMMAKRIEKAGNGEYKVEAYSEGEYKDHADGACCILIGPQIRYMLEDIKKDTGGKIPVIAIEPREYGSMAADKVLARIKQTIGAE